MLGCLAVVLAGLNGLFWLANGLAVILGFVQLVLWNWTGIWQWTLLALGIGVVRFVVFDLIVRLPVE